MLGITRQAFFQVLLGNPGPLFSVLHFLQFRNRSDATDHPLSAARSIGKCFTKADGATVILDWVTGHCITVAEGCTLCWFVSFPNISLSQFLGLVVFFRTGTIM